MRAEPGSGCAPPASEQVRVAVSLHRSRKKAQSEKHVCHVCVLLLDLPDSDPELEPDPGVVAMAAGGGGGGAGQGVARGVAGAPALWRLPDGAWHANMMCVGR